MLIRLGYDIELQLQKPATIVAMLNVHPSRMPDLREPDAMQISPPAERSQYPDCFGNLCTLITALEGPLRLRNSTLIEDSGLTDASDWNAPQTPIENLPPETMQFFLSSRYCEVDRLSEIAWELFGHIPPGWPRAQAVCDWVYYYVTFGAQFARSTRTAVDTYNERQGISRDFQHLAITFCRALHMPARYATGYLGPIGVPPSDGPIDFSSWYEVWLGDRWWSFDARYQQPRIGRILMTTGRDAADVAPVTVFGPSTPGRFSVITEELSDQSAGEEETAEAEITLDPALP